ASAGSGGRRNPGRAVPARRGTQDLGRPPTSRAEVLRVLGSAFRARSVRRRGRKSLPAKIAQHLSRLSSGCLDEGADSVVILDSRFGLQARACVDRPRPHGLDCVCDVLGGEPAGEDDAAFGGAGTIEVPGIFLLPGAIDYLRDLLVAAEQD